MSTQHGVSPPGWERTVEKMKEDPSIENPFALAWWLQDQGYDAGLEGTALNTACERYRVATRVQASTEPCVLAAAGVAWAQAQLLGRRLGQPWPVYRESAG